MAGDEKLCNAAQAAPCLRISAIMPLLRALNDLGPAGDVLLAEHRLDRGVPRDPTALIPVDTYLALFERAAVVTGEPCLGARLGFEMKAADLGPGGLAFAASSTIRSAFERLSRPMNALQSGTTIALHPDGPDRLVWTYQVAKRSSGPRRQDSEFTLASVYQMVRLSFDGNWRPLEVLFEHSAPRNLAALQKIFDVPLRFNQPSNGLVLGVGAAEKVYRSDDEAVLMLLDRHLAELGTETAGASSMRQKVVRVIGLLLGRTSVSISTVAREIGCSERTLQRRLAEEGTSLRALVRDQRQERAALYLGQKGVRRAVLAEKLGYADSTVLWRATKTWNNATPAAKRPAVVPNDSSETGLA